MTRPADTEPATAEDDEDEDEEAEAFERDEDGDGDENEDEEEEDDNDMIDEQDSDERSASMAMTTTTTTTTESVEEVVRGKRTDTIDVIQSAVCFPPHVVLSFHSSFFFLFSINSEAQFLFSHFHALMFHFRLPVCAHLSGLLGPC